MSQESQTQKLVVLNGPETPRQVNTTIQEWLGVHRKGVESIIAKVNPETWSNGKIIFLPLDPGSTTTLIYQDRSPEESSEEIHFKGTDEEADHRLVIAATAKTRFAQGVKPPHTEYVAFDPITGQSLPVTPGETVTKHSVIKRGLGSVSSIGIIGETKKKTGGPLSPKRTDGVILWVHPDFIASEFNQSSNTE